MRRPKSLKKSPTCFDKTVVFSQKRQNKWEIFSNFCGLFRKTEVCNEIKIYALSLYRSKNIQIFWTCLNCFGLEQKFLLKAALNFVFRPMFKTLINIEAFAKEFITHTSLFFIFKAVCKGPELFWTYKRTRHIWTSLPNF